MDYTSSDVSTSKAYESFPALGVGLQNVGERLAARGVSAQDTIAREVFSHITQQHVAGTNAFAAPDYITKQWNSSVDGGLT